MSKIDFQHIKKEFLKWRLRNIPERRFVIILSVVVGVLSGCAAVLLKNLVHFTYTLITNASWSSVIGGNVLMLIYPFIGIVLTVLFLKYFVKGDIGHGIPNILYSISRKKGKIPIHNTYSSLIASTLTVAFGGSVGLEAPIATTGSAIGSNIGKFFHLNSKNVILLLGCGAAGAIAGIFKAPIAGILFVLEVLMFDLTMTAAIPLLMSSISASLIAYFFMGNDVRLQNELTAYPASFMNERIEHDHATQEQAMEFLQHVKECGRRYNAELQERVGEHPMLSRRYIDYLTGYYRAGMGESLMQGMYSVEGDKLPVEYIAFADSLWNSMIAPLSTDGFSTLSSPKSLYRDYLRFLTDYMYYKVQNMPEQEGSVAKTLQRLAACGTISLDEKQACAVNSYDSELEKMKAQLATLDGEAEREKLISEFNNSEIVYIINDVWNSNADAIIREFAVKIPQHAISSLPNNKEIYDIYMAGIIWNEINNRRIPLPADVIEWAEKNISTPAAINTVLEMQNRYLALQRRALSGGESLKTNDEVKEMSDGEKILRKLIEPYKGKMVLIDVWGTWCSPCRQALSHSKELYNRMAQYDIVFLYLANRSDDESWKNVIKEYNVTGENVVHYNLPEEQQSAVESFLKVNQYPTYRLIDRNGNLLDVNADPRDLDAFESLLKMIQ